MNASTAILPSRSGSSQKRHGDATPPIGYICQTSSSVSTYTTATPIGKPSNLPSSAKLHRKRGKAFSVESHKWLCAPKGSGFLYARPERREMLDPLIVSWGWRSRDPGVSPFQDYFEWTGTQDPAAYLSVPAAIQFQAEHNWPAVRDACHALADEAQRRIGELTGLAPISPDGPEWWGQMRAIPLPKNESVTGEALKARLWDEYQIEIPIHDHGDYRLVRLSIQAYNSPADVDRLVEALAAIR